MTAEAWREQGVMLGCISFERTYAMNTGATSNPGTVQAHIDRALAKAEAEKAMQCVDKHIDPVVYGMRYHAALTQALAALQVG
jgi:hypothetical protein